MNSNEKLLLDMIKSTKDKNMQAYILQTYVQQFGPLPNALGDKVKKIMEGD